MDANLSTVEEEIMAKDTEEAGVKAPVETQEKQSRLSRRAFLSGIGAAGVAVTAQPLIAAVPEPVKQEGAEAVAEPGTVPLVLKVNGVERRLNVEPRVALLDCLRENLNLPGTKKGCDHGQCGACTVHVNGRRVLSCMSLAVMHAKDEITTIEGLGSPEKMHPMQASFVENDAYQCGYCTSGQIMSAVAVLKEPVGPSDDDVRHAMYGNICRCGAYPNIVAAVQQMRRLG
jgi:xanthine dehydrogenase YagT iron-sulfur-binding subunit